MRCIYRHWFLEAPERGQCVDYTIENTPAQKWWHQGLRHYFALNGKEV
ncbi:MAG: hypothetical protein IPJ74_15340 [Saprospiraceae bacterium]|nr:hypothetical protein [Saprospiraceae bacterium]